MSVSAPLPATAAATQPADQPPVSEPLRPAKPEPPMARRDSPNTGADSEAESAGRKRRKRDYGRWV